MKFLNIENYQFLEISQNPSILISLKSNQCFSALTLGQRAQFLKNNFGIETYQEFNQVHETDIFERNLDPNKNYDGFIEAKHKRAYGLKTADCIPLILWNEQLNKLMGLHCGWRGLAKGIIQKAFGMKNALEFNQAFIGPHITKKYFEVKQDLIDFFKQQNIDLKPFLYEQENVKTLDIKGFCIHQIKELNPRIIIKNGFCSYENNDLFYSWRKSKEPARRNITISWL